MAKILYLEDEPWQVESTVITVMEKEFGHDVTLVKSTDEALAALSTTAYDAVFLDIMMHYKAGAIDFENSGLLVAQRILDGEFAAVGNPSTLPIVIASGVWDSTVTNATNVRWTVEDRARSLGIPSHCFLRKPFLAGEVHDVLEQALREGDEV
jgi:CheY-like chemotaxis protein